MTTNALRMMSIGGSSTSTSSASHGKAATTTTTTTTPPTSSSSSTTATATSSPLRVQKHPHPHHFHHHHHAANNNTNSSSSISITSHSGTPQRPRLNSREIPRTYSGLYGQGGDDLLPFELARNWHTDWLERGGFLLLGTYTGGICIFQLVVLAVMESSLVSSIPPVQKDLPLYWSWTVTNAVHCLLTTVYLHWLKGSLFDEQGEMSAMTLWEQLEGRPNTIVVKRTLTIVPTLLCYAACHFSQYDGKVCLWNVLLWTLHVSAKLPIMNGVRIFGINRTTGIDDIPVPLDKLD